MKILFLADFIPPRHIGGPGKRNWEVAVKLAQLGHEVFFITSCQNKKQEIEETREKIRIFNVYSKYSPVLRDYFNIYNPFVLGKIKKIIKQVKPDVVHADMVNTHLSYASLSVAKKYASAVFLHARDFMLFNFGKFFQKERVCGAINYRVSWLDNLKAGRKRFNPFRRLFIRKYIKNADKIFAISQELAEALAQNGITNVAVLHNGFPLSATEPEFGGFEAKTIYLFGRLNEAKGVYALLDAFPLIKEKVPAAKIILAGADNYEQKKIKAYISEKRLPAADIEVLGWMSGDQATAILKSVSLVVSPSIYPDPLLAGANFEAASFKKPIVTTCFGGAKEFVLDGRTGYVVNPFDIKELAAKITELLGDKEKARSFGEAAYQRLQADFSLDEYVKNLLSWYAEFLKRA
ncbi:MAG: glycosyltransferase family 4 protein [Candidatus Portnoybacteria bacterium]|nr:glycosyltransferase family 4 protein [Candidatus Portnoybacteria bacterium]MDD4982488.1 glycosyltransferase family 4 protein [Candidatus Portnoybacteria bacterium]